MFPENCSNISGIFNLHSGKASSFFIANNSTNETIVMEYEDSVNKSKTTSALIRVLVNAPNQQLEIDFRNDEFGNKTFWSKQKNIVEIHPGNYFVYVSDSFVQKIRLSEGGVYTIVITENLDSNFVRLFDLFRVVRSFSNKTKNLFADNGNSHNHTTQ